MCINQNCSERILNRIGMGFTHVTVYPHAHSSCLIQHARILRYHHFQAFNISVTSIINQIHLKHRTHIVTFQQNVNQNNYFKGRSSEKRSIHCYEKLFKLTSPWRSSRYEHQRTSNLSNRCCNYQSLQDGISWSASTAPGQVFTSLMIITT